MNNGYCKYIEKGTGSRFVFIFMVLLVICAVLLIFKQDKIAESLANFAYLFLILGSFVRFIQMIKGGLND